MAVKITWYTPDNSNYTKVKIYRSTTHSGTYSEIAEVNTTSDGDPKSTSNSWVTSYIDSNGTEANWYKLSFYDSELGEYQDFGEKFQPNYITKLCSIDEIKEVIDTVGRWTDGDIFDAIVFIEDLLRSEIGTPMKAVKTKTPKVDDTLQDLFFIGEEKIAKVDRVFYGTATKTEYFYKDGYTIDKNRGMIKFYSSANGGPVLDEYSYLEVHYVPMIYNRLAVYSTAKHLLETTDISSGQGVTQEYQVVQNRLQNVEKTINERESLGLSSDFEDYDPIYETNLENIDQKPKRNLYLAGELVSTTEHIAIEGYTDAEKIRGVLVSTTDPSDGEILVYRSSTDKYEFETLSGITDTRANISDSGSQIITNVEDINFSSNLSVTDDGNGSVTVDATDTDTNTHTNVSESGIEILSDVADINFTQSGAASVSVTDDGDGSVSVNVDATDTDTTYSAGTGLTLNGTEFAIVESEIDHNSLSNYNSSEHIDWSLSQTENIHDDNIASSSITQHETDIDHTNISNVGTNSHNQIDSHISSTSNPHSVNASQVGALSSVDGVSNDGGDVDLVNGGNVTITADNSANTITFSVPNDLTVMSNYSTDDLSEGSSNLYYTDTRVSNNSDVSANTTHRSSDGTDHTYINQDVRDTASPSFGNIYISEDGKVAFDSGFNTYFLYNSSTGRLELWVNGEKQQEWG